MQTETQIALQKKFQEITANIKATYTAKTEKVDIKAALEEMQKQNEEKRAERRAKFDAKLAEVKANQAIRSAKLRERLNAKINIPETKDNIFETAKARQAEGLEKLIESIKARRQDR